VTDQDGGDSALDVAHGLEDALAQVALLVAVAELDGLVLAGGGAGGHGGAAEGAAGEATSTSTVGLPRESMISRAVMAEMVVFMR
jgi:hypothetical protein